VQLAIPGTSPLVTLDDADRDTWCTPKWITDAIGRFDLDPCSNPRSTVQSELTFRLDRGQDGLEQAAWVTSTARVFVNPPYSDVMPWVQAYKHTRFCFLVKFDPSTKWCEALIEHTSIVLFPRRTRIEFAAPPGVESSSNPFPHCLAYARAADATDAIRALCFSWAVIR
jgi:hypothetical protein